MNLWFSRFASRTAQIVGHPYMFLFAVAVIILWGVTGPYFHYSDTWQLIINTSTTIITFLMVFLIQNTQNRDSEAMQLKLDELIRATKTAHTALLDVEELSEEELEKLRRSYQKLAREAIALHPQCVECGRTDDLTADHVVPLSQGGKSEAGNYQVLCRSCNTSSSVSSGRTSTVRRDPLTRRSTSNALMISPVRSPAAGRER